MMDLPKVLVNRLTDMGITDPTPIQKRAIPHALNGEDVMGLAQTGTGKTAAFGVPLIAQMMQYDRKPAGRTARGLVLAPTRELANQISQQLKGLLEGTPMKVGLVVGGVSINPQIQRIAKGTDILVATPGRLLDILDRRALDLGACDFLVLDEADQMLDLGFIHALRKIAPALGTPRQTMLFSATMSKQMEELSRAYLNNPRKVQVSPPGKAADKVTQSVHFLSKPSKPSKLREILSQDKDALTLVFSRTKHGAEKLMKGLVADGFNAASIHGNKSQGQRDRAIKAFRDGTITVLVATDVAARGIDIPGVAYVINYDLPDVPDNYVHRIGRTARAGREGEAIAFCSPEESDLLRQIQKLMKMEIPIASGTSTVGDRPAGKGGNRPGSANHQRRRGGGGGGGGGRYEPPKGGGGKPGGAKRRRPRNRAA